MGGEWASRKVRGMVLFPVLGDIMSELAAPDLSDACGNEPSSVVPVPLVTFSDLSWPKKSCHPFVYLVSHRIVHKVR